MEGLFDSAWLKWGWAVVHAQALEVDVSDYTLQASIELPYSTRTEYDPKRHCVRVLVDSIEPLPSRWGLRIGDIANNFRAALDHLAWALYQGGSKAGTLTAKQERGIYFPFADTADEFRAKIGQIPGIRRADCAIVRRYQPYIRGKTNLWRHCLTPLPRLTADDKHKEIRAVWSIPITGRVYHGPPKDCEISRVPSYARRVVLDVGTEIQRIYVRRTGPDPDVEMEAKIIAHPTLDGRILLADWIAQTTFHIRNLIWEFADPPKYLDELGIKPAEGQGPPPPVNRQ